MIIQQLRPEEIYNEGEIYFVTIYIWYCKYLNLECIVLAFIYKYIFLEKL